MNCSKLSASILFFLSGFKQLPRQMPLCAGITHISRSPGPFSWNTVKRLSRAKLSLNPSPKLNPSDLFSSLQSTPLPTAVYTSWTQLWWKTSHFFYICSSFVILCTVLDQCELPCWSSVVSDGLPRTMFWTKRSQFGPPWLMYAYVVWEWLQQKWPNFL